MKNVYKIIFVFMLALAAHAQEERPECLDTLYIFSTGPLPQTEQANILIVATNVISTGITKYNHAGSAIQLKQGFSVTNSSVYRGYIQGCDILLPRTDASQITTADDSKDALSADTSNAIALWPNPAENVVNISSGKVIRSITVLSTEGKIVMDISNNNSRNEYSFPISGLSQGYYTVTVTTTDGQVHTQRLIKN